MKKTTAVFFSAVLAGTLLFGACTIVNGGLTDSFAYELQGTWETLLPNDDVDKEGTLEIGLTTIEISGFPKSNYKFPLARFERNILLEGYSVKNVDRDPPAYEGTLYIEYEGKLQSGIPFVYHQSAGKDRLSFHFKNNYGIDEVQTLKKVED